MERQISSAQCVIFDFDGPLCHLFARRTAASVAGRLRAAYAATSDGSAGSWPETTDPLRLLTAAFDDPTLLEPQSAQRMERSLTREEVAAAEVAFPTGYADTLVRTLCATGRRVAVATDNSAEAVERYLAGRSLLEAFSPARRPGSAPSRVCGRVCDGAALKLKPDPDCVLRALESAGTEAAETVMIGDSERDVAAARAAGVGFVGYARNERKGRELRRAGAEWVVASLRDILLTVDPLAHV
ncbi:HAD family hydrolase [Streptomyces spirodelae]|uniref:HAD family hydrolase n=1 Tax=Streptomyces spirodelae TaxID=2812904 RepID=A0ABS3WXZ1_9ACTN|nr:HAD-IA family hydrolase [Streptomyces spirodelae]MBO8187988.1 HAD family hydrolase [Streptomyces spirodelae]